MKLIESHGGELKNLLLPRNTRSEFLDNKCPQLFQLKLNPRQLCDLELLMNGAFSPLCGFMLQRDYDHVLQHMRLNDDTLWPIPIILDITKNQAERINIGDEISLLDQEGFIIAILQVEDKWEPDKLFEAQQVYHTVDPDHPGVKYLLECAGDVYLGGKILGIQRPRHYDFVNLRQTPQELRDYFTQQHWFNVVAFQTRNPIHRAHHDLTIKAAKQVAANLLIHPVVGETKVGDIAPEIRVRCYQQVMSHYPKKLAKLSLIPLAMRMAGPREAVWHAIIRKNYGCNHIIIGRDHAGAGKDNNDNDFYPAYAAQELVAHFEKELKINMLPFQEIVYVENTQTYLPINEVTTKQKSLKMSGTAIRNSLKQGRKIPDWFSFPEVIKELQQAYPPLYHQGFTVLLTGLPAAGKSTIAQALKAKLATTEHRQITILDGDVIRDHISPELGYSSKDRDTNILRIGFIAKQINYHRGIVICPVIAPYQNTRNKIRRMITEVGGFIEVYLATPLEVCMQRDGKGLYTKAMQGILKNFTGISDPYEAPIAPEVTINTAEDTVEQALEKISLAIKQSGYIDDDEILGDTTSSLRGT